LRVEDRTLKQLSLLSIRNPQFVIYSLQGDVLLKEKPHLATGGAKVFTQLLISQDSLRELAPGVMRKA
jgi:hypothetical protein